MLAGPLEALQEESPEVYFQILSACFKEVQTVDDEAAECFRKRMGDWRITLLVDPCSNRHWRTGRRGNDQVRDQDEQEILVGDSMPSPSCKQVLYGFQNRSDWLLLL